MKDIAWPCGQGAEIAVRWSSNPVMTMGGSVFSDSSMFCKWLACHSLKPYVIYIFIYLFIYLFIHILSLSFHSFIRIKY